MDGPPYSTTGPYPHYASLHHPPPLTNLQLTRLPSTTIIIKYSTFAKNNLPSPMALFTICNTPTIAINMGTIATGNTLLSANLTMGKHCLSLQTLTLTQYTLECAFHHMPFPSCASDVDLPLPPT